MDFLTLVQNLHYEAKLPGSPPDAVTAQSGRNLDLVRWTAAAWADIQREKDGRWKWLLSDYTVDTVADTASYAYGDCTDVDDAATITRFKAWELDEESLPFIYRVSEGVATERELLLYEWPEFRSEYVKGTHTAAPPSLLSVNPRDRLFLGPTPDAIYTLSGSYWKGAQTLAADADVPECPADYHMLIVYRALLKYAYNIVAQEILARAVQEGTPLFDALILNQWHGRFRMRWPKALA